MIVMKKFCGVIALFWNVDSMEEARAMILKQYC